MKCPREEECMHCGAWGECWWMFPPPWRLCATCYEHTTGHAPRTGVA